MLKIKDNVDLKELEKFKYYEGTIMFQPEKKVFFKQISILFLNTTKGIQTNAYH